MCGNAQRDGHPLGFCAATYRMLLTCIYTVSQKKGTSVFLSITLANINRFSNFFHC